MFDHIVFRKCHVDRVKRQAFVQQGEMCHVAGCRRPAHGLVQVLQREAFASRLGYSRGAGRIQGDFLVLFSSVFRI